MSEVNAADSAVVTEDSTESTSTDTQDNAEKVHTQAELDRIVQERVARERAKYSDYDSLKSQAENAAREALSEQERAVADARVEARTEALKDANTRLIKAEARGIAADLGWHYPADAHLYLNSDSLVTESGDVDTVAIEKALQDAAEKRPALVRAESQTAPAAHDAGIGTASGKTHTNSGGAFMESLLGN